MKKFLALALSLTMVLSLAACGKKEPDKEEKKQEETKVKMALITDTIGTEQFILQAYNAFMDASKQYDFEAVSIECSDTAEISEKARNACVEGYNLIIGVGWTYAEPLSELADEFTDIKFAVIDTVASNDKVKSVAFNTSGGAYVLGTMAAAAFPDDELFGYIGNFQNQSNFEYRYGFEQGVKSLKPDAKFLVNYTDSYSDTTVAYNLAMQQAAAGCQFIMGSVANSANQGIYTAALELAQKGTPIYTSGLSVDQTTSDNPYIVGGLTKNTGVCTTAIIEEFLAGNFTGGSEILGFADNAFCVVGVSFEANYRNGEIITDDVLAAGKKAGEDLRNGTVKLEVPLEADYTG